MAYWPVKWENYLVNEPIEGHANDGGKNKNNVIFLVSGDESDE